MSLPSPPPHMCITCALYNYMNMYCSCRPRLREKKNEGRFGFCVDLMTCFVLHAALANQETWPSFLTPCSYQVRFTCGYRAVDEQDNRTLVKIHKNTPIKVYKARLDDC